ncbi:MAG: hypothetical protein WAZ19_06675 [Anaerolineae bacterium]
MPAQPDFTPVFEQLKTLLTPHQAALVVTADSVTAYSLHTHKLGPNRKPFYFGGVVMNKNYVSLHLMAVYVHPELLTPLSDGLRRRMQGKSCFNFKQPLDATQLDELRHLTAQGLAALQQDSLA